MTWADTIAKLLAAEQALAWDAVLRAATEHLPAGPLLEEEMRSGQGRGEALIEVLHALRANGARLTVTSGGLILGPPPQAEFRDRVPVALAIELVNDLTAVLAQACWALHRDRQEPDRTNGGRSGCCAHPAGGVSRVSRPSSRE